MNNINLRSLATTVFTAALALSAYAQPQVNRSAYFLDGTTHRHLLNPAFMGERNYVSMPGLGNLSIGMQGNAGVANFLYPKSNGDLMTFMHESVNKKQFIDGISGRTKLGFNLNEDILSGGFFAWGGFNTIGFSIKSNTNASIPKEMFRFMKYGVDAPEGTQYHINDMHVTSTNYAEIAFGHARQINEQWTVGAKVKFLVGLAKATIKIDQLDVTATPDRWEITSKGAQAYLSAKGFTAPTKGETGNYDESDYVLDANGNRTDQLKPGADKLLSYDDMDFDGGKTGPTGFGMAFDLGASYKFNDDLTFSAAILDLGFIGWKNTVKATMSNEFEFDGFHEIPINSDLGDDDPNSIDNQSTQIGDDLEEFSKFTKEGENLKRSTALAATLNLAAEYTFPLYRKLSFGFLSSTRIQGKHSWSEGRLSANVAPISWFEASLSYAVSSFGSGAGVMVNFHPKRFNLFLAADLPFRKYSSYYIPLHGFGLNANFGINFTF